MSALSFSDELALYLRPAGGGVHTVSSGKKEQWALQQTLYRVNTEEALQEAHLQALEKVTSARVVVVACPSDVGAGILRGANGAPAAIRAQLLQETPSWPEEASARGIVDVGDVLVVPQLLHDDMLSEEQKEATRKALYPGQPQPLPVSPLSMSERVFELLFAINPQVKVFLLGGDHSTAWPLAKVLSTVRPGPLGIVQPDAHTDLLEERLGVRYCFATWSYHANRLLGGNGKLVQVGTRASGKTKAHWEGTLGVRQFWAEEVRENPDRALEAIVAHVRSTGVSAVYLSNDIDGTDSRFADATGTPEPFGLTPDFVVELIRRLGKEVGLCAADVMEVAPTLQRTPDGAQRTVSLAVRYMKESLSAML